MTLVLIGSLLLASSASRTERDVLASARCNQCHDSTVSAANQAALAVYDLAEPRWAARMTDAQLPKLITRLKGAPAADQKIVRDFIEVELKRRAEGRPSPRRSPDPPSHFPQEGHASRR
jgi:hypothetical protein